jgi:hypothetical protein
MNKTLRQRLTVAALVIAPERSFAFGGEAAGLEAVALFCGLMLPVVNLASTLLLTIGKPPSKTRCVAALVLSVAAALLGGLCLTAAFSFSFFPWWLTGWLMGATGWSLAMIGKAFRAM